MLGVRPRSACRRAVDGHRRGRSLRRRRLRSARCSRPALDHGHEGHGAPPAPAPWDAPPSARRRPRDEPTFYDPRVRSLRVSSRACVPAGSRWTCATPRPRSSPSNDLASGAYDVCIYFANVRFVGNSNSLRVSWAPWQGPDAPRHPADFPTVLVSIADPLSLQDLAMVRTALNGYTPTSSTVDAALEVLFGERPATGTSRGPLRRALGRGALAGLVFIDRIKRSRSVT